MSSSQTEIPAGLADVPVTKSAVSVIDGKRALLSYRGIPVETLAKESSFEETAWLLLKGELPTQRQLADFHHALRQRRKIHYRLIEVLKQFPPNGHPMDALQSSVAALGLFYPARDVANAASNWEATLRLIAAMPTLVAAFARLRKGDEPLAPHPDLDHAGNLYYMLFGREPSPSVRKVIDACLILHAEHTMNASTFSSRVTASTLADPYTVISSAIGTLTGPLHGGANEEVLDMLDEIGSPANARRWAEQAVTGKRKIMGFGHRVYKDGDPRAVYLKELCGQLAKETGNENLETMADVIERVIWEEKKLPPNLDWPSARLYHYMGLPIELYTPIFVLSRTSGWAAHVIEQHDNNRLIRPRARYTGPAQRPWVPIADR
jgi:2-methylcitrate synthase